MRAAGFIADIAPFIEVDFRDWVILLIDDEDGGALGVVDEIVKAGLASGLVVAFHGYFLVAVVEVAGDVVVNADFAFTDDVAGLIPVVEFLAVPGVGAWHVGVDALVFVVVGSGHGGVTRVAGLGELILIVVLVGEFGALGAVGPGAIFLEHVSGGVVGEGDFFVVFVDFLDEVVVGGVNNHIVPC